MFVLDTNVISELRKGQKANRNVAEWASGMDIARQFLSAITVFELEYGIRLAEIRGQPDAQELRQWLDETIVVGFASYILPLDDRVAVTAARLQASKSSPERDLFIAATAIVHGMVLVTRNTRDVQNTGVKLLNPWLPQP